MKRPLRLFGIYGTSGAGKGTRMGQCVAYFKARNPADCVDVYFRADGRGVKKLGTLVKSQRTLFIGKWVVSGKSKLISWSSFDYFIRLERGGKRTWDIIKDVWEELPVDNFVFDGAVETSAVEKIRDAFEGGPWELEMHYAYIAFEEGNSGWEEFVRRIMARSGPTGKAGNSFKINRTALKGPERHAKMGIGVGRGFAATAAVECVAQFYSEVMGLGLEADMALWSRKFNTLRDWAKFEESHVKLQPFVSEQAMHEQFDWECDGCKLI